MKQFVRLVAFITAAFLVEGCSSTSGIDSKTFNQGAAKISLGMSKTDFIALFPTAEPRGAKAYPGGSVEVLEQKVSQFSFWGSNDASYRRNEMTGAEMKVVWFYFYNGKLVQYGAPNDWPAHPDQIIEIRQR